MPDTNINPLTSSLSQLLNTEPIRSAVDRFAEQGGSGNFSDILTEAINTTNVTDAMNKTSSADVLTNMEDDLSGALIDMQKAELALQLTLQIRNKILDAYNEVMRMSI